MDQQPLFLTKFALARVLKEFALALGLNEVMADVAAQAHLQISPSAQRWSDFLEHNCGVCRMQPNTCYFLNPTTADYLPEGATPESKTVAIGLNIETGIIKRCPAFIPEE